MAVKSFSSAQIIALRTLYFASWGGTLIILLTAIFAKLTKRKLDRYATWYLFCVGWIVSGISQTLLPLAGLKMSGQPSSALCLAQGVLTYSSSTLTTFTTLALVLQTWLHVRSVTGPTNSVTVATLIVLPLLLWGVLTVEMLVFGLKHATPPTIMSADGRCVVIESKMLTTQSLVLGCIGALGILVTQGAISFHVWKDRRAFKEHAFSVIRVGLFCCIVAFAFALQLAVLINKSIIGAYELRVVVALVSLFAPLIFGTQMDLIRVWMFWKKEKPDTTAQRFSLHPAQAGWKFDPEQDYRARQDDNSVRSYPDHNLITRFGHS